MGIIDFFKTGKDRILTLDVVSMEKWPEQLLRLQGLHTAMEEFLDRVERRKAKLNTTKTKLANPRLKEKLPERVHEIYDDHLPTIVSAIDEILSHSFVDSLFLVEDQQEDFHEVVNKYHEVTRKSVAALKEFLGEELQNVQQAIKELEDEVVNLAPELEKRHFNKISKVKELIEEYDATREKERKLKHLHETLNEEIDLLEARKRKVKEKIQYYSERSGASEFKELFAQEDQLLQEMEGIKLKTSSAKWNEALAPMRKELAMLRKQMINDVTALNINEQRTFLEAAKDDIMLRKRKLDRVNELLEEVSYQTYRKKFQGATEPFRVRIEDADVILESEEESDTPQ